MCKYPGRKFLAKILKYEKGAWKAKKSRKINQQFGSRFVSSPASKLHSFIFHDHLV